MPARYIFALVSLLTLMTPAAADVMPDAHKSVNHYVRFENLTDYPNYVFISAQGPGQFRKPKEPGPYAIDAKRLASASDFVKLEGGLYIDDLYLLAVTPKLVENWNGKVMSDWIYSETPGVLRAKVGTGHRYLPISDARDELWMHCRVEIKDGKMTLTKMRDDRYVKNPVNWRLSGGLAAFAAALLVGWFVHARRK